MNFTDHVKKLISSKAVKDASTALLEDTIEAILGDPVAAGKVLLTLMRSPFFLREQLFWRKMEAYLNGVYIDENDKAKLCAKLVVNGEKTENTLRLIEYIDRAETQKKIRCLINATRCLLSDFIDLPAFFRICHAITHTLMEDLLFLQEHIREENLSYCPCVQGLLTSGLMYQSVIDGGGDQKYSFTPAAHDVDQFAVSYDIVERYPNPTSGSLSNRTPQVKVEIPTMSNDEISEIINATFDNK